MFKNPLPHLSVLGRSVICLPLTLILSACCFLSYCFPYGSQQEPPAMVGQAEYYYQEGKRLVDSGDLDRALVAFQKALNLDPALLKAYNESAIILTINGQIEDAQAMFLRAIAVDPHYAEPYSNLALLYEEEGDYGKALICWQARADLGTVNDPWTEIARTRVNEIAQAYPGIYNAVEEGRYTLEIEKFAPPSGAIQQFHETRPVEYDEPGKVSLFKEDAVSDRERSDKKAAAREYMGRAQDFYNKGEFVGALREATIAEYLDPANQDITSFVQQIREAILQ